MWKDFELGAYTVYYGLTRTLSDDICPLYHPKVKKQKIHYIEINKIKGENQMGEVLYYFNKGWLHKNCAPERLISFNKDEAFNNIQKEYLSAVESEINWINKKLVNSDNLRPSQIKSLQKSKEICLRLTGTKK